MYHNITEIGRKAMWRLRYMDKTSGLVAMEDLPEEVTYGKEKLLLFQKKTDKIKPCVVAKITTQGKE